MTEDQKAKENAIGATALIFVSILVAAFVFNYFDERSWNNQKVIEIKDIPKESRVSIGKDKFIVIPNEKERKLFLFRKCCGRWLFIRILII